MNKNQPVFLCVTAYCVTAYCVTAELYEKMPETLDDQILVKIVKERKNQPLIDVDIAQYL
ncbi:hypothetical protein [Xenorhabdus sp. NBAII XenSa04]|uniref:hypothetical protein n=1 Tax=Xenorhabdus sp. NBAII XenSa04 TaxID=1429873 RepID=UPI00068E4061